MSKKNQRIIVKGFDKNLEKTLVSRGVPQHDLPRIKIDVSESLVKIEPDIPNIKSKAVSPLKQYKLLEAFLEHPLRSNSAICISSFPSDLRAKHLAIHIMAGAIKQHQEGLYKPGRSLPLWHRVYGGFGDALRDKSQQEIPSLLVIANVNYDSTSAKIEKVRDLLEMYSEIPKIIVTGGTPPCNLFANKLYFPLKFGIYLGPSNRIISI